jgi:hypothetical protein
LYLLQRFRERLEKLAGQCVEEQSSDKGRLTGSRYVDRCTARLRRYRVRRPAVVVRSNQFDKASFEQPTQLMRCTAPFAANF